jgi:hypothetical protein
MRRSRTTSTGHCSPAWDGPSCLLSVVRLWPLIKGPAMVVAYTLAFSRVGLSDRLCAMWVPSLLSCRRMRLCGAGPSKCSRSSWYVLLLRRRLGTMQFHMDINLSATMLHLQAMMRCPLRPCRLLSFLRLVRHSTQSALPQLMTVRLLFRSLPLVLLVTVQNLRRDRAGQAMRFIVRHRIAQQIGRLQILIRLAAPLGHTGPYTDQISRPPKTPMHRQHVNAHPAPPCPPGSRVRICQGRPIRCRRLLADAHRIRIVNVHGIGIHRICLLQAPPQKVRTLPLNALPMMT